MNFREAVNRLTDGKATRTNTMLGYVKRVDATKVDGDAWTSKWDIVFVERATDGNTDSDGYAQYKFTHTVSSAGVETVTGPDHTLSLDQQLYKLLLQDDWEIFDTTDAEAARTNTGSRW